MSLRILHAVEFYSPSSGGAQEVVRQVSERLAGLGHEVTVATSVVAGRRAGSIGGVQIEEFDVSGNAVRGIVGEADRYRSFVLEGEFDIVMTYAAQQWTTDALLPALDEVRAPFVLAPCGFSGLADPAYAAYFDKLRSLLPKFDALVLHSDTYQDAQFARKAGARNIRLITNGADEREFATLPSPRRFRREWNIGDGAPLAITVGGHTGLKGHEETMRAFLGSEEFAGGVLAILANQPTGRGCGFRCRQSARVRNFLHRDRRIVVAEAPRKSVVEAFSAADLFLFCSMVECSPLVLFESMAAGVPFVSLDVGNAAEIAEWGNGGVIVPSSRDAHGLVRAPSAAVSDEVDILMADPDRRVRMGEGSRAVWQESFTWDEISRRYAGLYEELAR